MKQILFFLVVLFVSTKIFGQSTPVLEIRVPTAATTFGVSVPIGTKVYNVADGKYWVATAGVLSSATLTTAAASFALINNTTDELQTISTATNTMTLSQSGGTLTVTGAGINSTVTSGSAGAATITITGTEVDGSVSNEGSLTVAAGTGTTAIINSNTSGQTGVTIAAGDGIGISESGNEITVTNTSMNTDAQTLTYTASARTMAISGGNTQTIPLADGTETNPGLLSKAKFDQFDALSQSTFKVESFTEAATNTSGQVNTLTHTPKAATAVLVSLNGFELPTGKYTVATNTVQITIPVYQYDLVSIAYTY